MTKKVDFDKMSVEELEKYRDEHLEEMTPAESDRLLKAFQRKCLYVTDDSAIFNLDKDLRITRR